MATQDVTTRAECIDPAAHKRATNLLHEIMQAAHNADRRCFHMPVNFDGSGDAEEGELFADGLRDSICRVGWLAETALISLGDGGSLLRDGKAENWLMSPVCRKEVSSHE